MHAWEKEVYYRLKVLNSTRFPKLISEIRFKNEVGLLVDRLGKPLVEYLMA